MTLETFRRVRNSAAPLTWLTTIAAILVTIVPGWPGLFEYHATAISHGEVWRIFTGHLTHWDFSHLFWDVSVFLVLGTLCEWRSSRRLVGCVAGTAAAVSLYMLVLLPEIPVYRGLSGIDTGLFTLLCVGIYQDARDNGDRVLQGMIAGMAVALFGKLVFEVVTGTTIFVDQYEADFIPIVAAHILGAIVGIVAGVSRRHSSWSCPLSSLTPE